MKALKAIMMIALICLVIFIGNLAILYILNIDVFSESQKSLDLITGFFYKPINIKEDIVVLPEVPKINEENKTEINNTSIIKNITTLPQNNTINSNITNKTKEAFKIDITGDGDLREFENCQAALDFMTMLYSADVKRKQSLEAEVEDAEDEVDRYEDLVASTTNPEKKSDYQDKLDEAKADLRILKDKLDRAEQSAESSLENLDRVRLKCNYMK